MNTLQIVGIVLMAAGLTWAFLLTRQGAAAPAGAGPEATGIDAWTKFLEACAKLAEGFAKVLGTRFGAPIVVFLAGVAFFAWGAAT
jgi:hypothetical protein